MNKEMLELTSKLMKEANTKNQVELLELVAHMPIADGDKIKILVAANAVFIDLMSERTDYLKNHMDKVEENLALVAEDLRRISNLL